MAKRHIRCIFCSSLETKRNGTRATTRGKVKRFSCLDCGKYFTLREEPRKRITTHEQVKITETHLEGRTSIRTLSRHTGHSPRTILAAIHKVTAACISAVWIAKHLKPEWSGYLGLDGKIVRVWDWSAKSFRYTQNERRLLHKMSLLLAMDLETQDFPTHHLGSEETAVDLVMFLQVLKEIGYPLRGYVSDGNPNIPRAVEKVFGKGIPHQLCVSHFLRGLKQKYWQGELAENIYRDARKQILQGKQPHFLTVPDTLFTYQAVPKLPRTNQQLEVAIRFLELRLKTIGIFRSWKTATDYCNTLVAMRRFTKFTDRKGGKENGKAPLELAGCNITGLKYLELGLKSSRKV